MDPKTTKQKLTTFLANIRQISIFIFVICIYIINRLSLYFGSRHPKFLNVYQKTFWPIYTKSIKSLDKNHQNSISLTNLIELSLSNMRSKKSRTWITMGGMALGIGLIVFLVSIGYGLEKLVINKVARLEELKQTDVVPGLSDDLTLTDQTIEKFKQIPNVSEVIPIISAVGKVNYNNSSSDMAVYGVTTNYLVESAIKPTQGRIFESNNLVNADYESRVVDSGTAQPTTSDEPSIVLSDTPQDGSLPIVKIATISGEKLAENTKVVTIGGSKNKEMVINQAALTILGIGNDALGKKIKVSLVVVGANNREDNEKLQSIETEYEIVGVIPETDTPVFYIPFIDLRSMGIEKFSQLKVIANKPENLSKIRQNIESNGYGTISVVDTIGQIDKLFRSVRWFLGTLGVVALSVAALGMFNTLTVSLLERTHEVGLMKAMGMKSSEVKELFLTESMIMGFFGGILGLIAGISVGYILSVAISIFSIFKGVGFLNLTYIPFPFFILIILISLLVGIGTGYLPARRATKISALDALRYE